MYRIILLVAAPVIIFDLADFTVCLFDHCLDLMTVSLLCSFTESHNCLVLPK